eukprot:301259-Pleurochrysis_carterae.AAC.1
MRSRAGAVPDPARERMFARLRLLQKALPLSPLLACVRISKSFLLSDYSPFASPPPSTQYLEHPTPSSHVGLARESARRGMARKCEARNGAKVRGVEWLQGFGCDDEEECVLPYDDDDDNETAAATAAQ